MIIIVFGLPGTGKSYFACRLARVTGAGYVNSDKLRKELFKTRSYSEQEKMAVYNEMLSQMRAAVANGRSIVLDGTFYKDDIRKIFTREMQPGNDIVFIEVQAAEELIKERLRKIRPYSEADFEVYLLIRQEWEPLQEPHLLLESTDNNINDMLEKAAGYLQMKGDKRTS